MSSSWNEFDQWLVRAVCIYLGTDNQALDGDPLQVQTVLALPAQPPQNTYQEAELPHCTVITRHARLHIEQGGSPITYSWEIPVWLQILCHAEEPVAAAQGAKKLSVRAVDAFRDAENWADCPQEYHAPVPIREVTIGYTKAPDGFYGWSVVYLSHNRR